MININFTTQLLSSTAQYQVIDLSTVRTGYQRKFLYIYAQDGNTILYQDTNIDINIDTVTVSTSNWGLNNALLQIYVEVGYVKDGSPSSLRKTWLLPTTLNLPGTI